jgi:hypothetical protein
MFLLAVVLTCFISSSYSDWTTMTIDHTEDTVFLNSIAVDNSGEVHVIYDKEGNSWRHHVYYATWKDYYWDIESIAEKDYGFNSSSVALDKYGNPHVAYFDYSGYLTYAYKNGSKWEIDKSTFSESWFDKFPSIVIDDSNNAHIIFYLYSYLRYAKRTSNGAWSMDIVDNCFSNFMQIDLDSNENPWIVYSNRKYELICTSWTGTSWHLGVVEDTSSIKCAFNSIAIDKYDNVHLAYNDVNSENLKYAIWDGVIWSTYTIDSEGIVGRGASITLFNDETPYISYKDTTRKKIKYAKKVGGSWQIEDVGNYGNTCLKTSIALENDGIIHITYDSDYNLIYACNKTDFLKDFKPDNSIKLINNVFNPNNGEKVSISIDLKESSFIWVQILSADGRIIKELINREPHNPGFFKITAWDGRDSKGDIVSSGIYLLKLLTESNSVIKKICVIK